MSDENTPPATHEADESVRLRLRDLEALPLAQRSSGYLDLYDRLRARLAEGDAPS